MIGKDQQKYILVTGGELRNKGAQAMSFITVDQIARRNPEYKVILFSSLDSKRIESEKNNYKFDIMPFPSLMEIISFYTGLLKKRYLKRENGKYFANYKKIFNNAVALLDISGFALGDKWGENAVKSYLKRIFRVTFFKIPVYLMPQSFGPFNFKGKDANKLHRKMKRILPKVKVIMARENEGFQMLVEKYNLQNVIKTPDMVLQNKGIMIENIYNVPPVIKDVQIEKGSVAIIPNSKNNKFGKEEEVLNFYQKAINMLLKKGKNVYLIYHALEDLDICKNIKQNYFANEKKVKLIEEELSCIIFDELVSKFDFIIGSRYHAIVHAYRKGVPAIILGWAIKYRELADTFSQKEYCFDSSNLQLHIEDILTKLEKMCLHYEQEALRISEGINKIQKENVFDLLDLKK